MPKRNQRQDPHLIQMRKDESLVAQQLEREHRDFVKANHASLEAALNRGNTYLEIAQTLRKNDIEIDNTAFLNALIFHIGPVT